MVKFGLVAVATVAAVSLLAASQVRAQPSYPAKPVRVIVPFIPGSAPDVLTRMVTDPLAQRLGQPFVIENRPGAGGNIGAELAARAAADGYTMVLLTSSHTTNPFLYRNAGYDPVKDFTPIALFAKMPQVLVVPVAAGFGGATELIASARSKPGAFNYGSGGNGSAAHLAGEAFRASAGIEVTHVPYRGAPEIVASLLGGQITYGLPNFSVAFPQVKAGKLMALAVTGAKRHPLLPAVPTMFEVMPGKGFELVAWFGFGFPAGAPPEAVNRIATEIASALQNQALRDKIGQDGTEIAVLPPVEFGQFIRSELVVWKNLVQISGARVD